MSVAVETIQQSAAVNDEDPHVPGEPAFWLMLLGDMLLFGLMFVTFVAYKYANPEQLAVFHEGRTTLNIYFGVANTALLLGSSWFVARAVRGARRGLPDTARRHIAAGFSCGAMFVVLKAFEYGEHIGKGYLVDADIFNVMYFSYTGIHLVHVLIGLGVLAYLWGNLPIGQRDGEDRTRIAVLEGGTCYWHMVDVFWIILFSLFYLAV